MLVAEPKSELFEVGTGTVGGVAGAFPPKLKDPNTLPADEVVTFAGSDGEANEKVADGFALSEVDDNALLNENVLGLAWAAVATEVVTDWGCENWLDLANVTAVAD